MFDHHGADSEMLANLDHVNQQLADLIPRLESADQACAEAARPLDMLDQLDSARRREVARRIRDAEQQWAQITQLIDQAMAKASRLGRHPPPPPVGYDSRSAPATLNPMLLPATDGLSLFVHRWLPEGQPPKAVVQIAHGVAEHGGRYARLAEALNAAGYAVYANDHRGHGRTARSPQELGFISESDGWRKCLGDLWGLNRRIASDHPGLPIILLGHSMGSFMAQEFITEHGDVLGGVVLCGTSGKAPRRMAAALRVLARFERWRVGAAGKSPLLGALTFGAFNKPFQPARTPFDWLSRDNAEVDRYAADPLCGGFSASVQLFIDVSDGIAGIARPKRRARIPRSLPIYLLAGMSDSVGANGAGVERLLTSYADAGLERVTHRFYPDARHELFNETNRDEVTHDLIRWLDDVID